MQCGYNLPSGFGEKSYQIVNRRRRQRTMVPAYTISSPGAFGSSKLKCRLTEGYRMDG